MEFIDRNGKVSYTMPHPEMSDSNIDEKSGISKKSYEIKYELLKEKDRYILKVVPNKEWLNSTERKYPIYIDPTFSKNVTMDTFVSSSQPTKNLNKYWNSTLGFYSLRVGKYDNATGMNYAFMKFPSMTSLVGATITSAKLSTHTRWNYYGSKRTDVWVDKVNGPWSETQLNWNNKPSSTNITKASAGTNEWLNFNVLSYVRSIAEGKADNGLKLHTNGNGQTHWKQLTASENASNKSKVSIEYSYPKMDSINTEPYTIPGTRNGYINIKWATKKGAKKYKLQMFDGIGWQTIYTGLNTNYSTKGKKIWPTTAQYNIKDDTTKGIKFRSGDGVDLPLDPSEFYSKSRGKTSTDKTYQFRVITEYALGSGKPSDPERQSILELIPETPKVPTVKSVETNSNDTATVNIQWKGVPSAVSYNVYMFNGTEYQKIDTVKGTSWSSKGKKIFPTDEQLNQLSIGTKNSLRTKNDGVELQGDASLLYEKVNPIYRNAKNYYFKVSAYSGKGESNQSDYLRVFAPTKSVPVHLEGYADNRKEDSGFLFANWDKVNDADGYAIYLFNGKNYELVEVLDKETTSWHSRDKKLWPKERGEFKLNRNGVVGGGKELPIDPSGTYVAASGEKEAKYKVKVTSFRKSGVNNGKVEANFLGESSLNDAEEKEVELKNETYPDFGDEEFYPTIETALGSFNVINNNQILTEIDSKLPGRGPEVDATRTFNSKTNQTGMFGLGWTSSFERKLNIADAEIIPKVVQYSDDDGSTHLFINHKNKLLPPAGIDYEFLIEGNEYVIQDDTGQREVYGKDGLLQRIEYDAKQKEKKNAIRFEYEEYNGKKRLKSVLSASDDSLSGQGNRITFSYNDENLVSSMVVIGTSDDNSISREYIYEYDKFNRLTSVNGPDGKYTYSYRDVDLAEDEENKNQDKGILYASEISKYGLPDNDNGTNEISAVYEDGVLKTIQDQEGIKTTYSIEKNENETIVDVENTGRANERFTFDSLGHLSKEQLLSEKEKITVFEWKDHRITKTMYPDGEIEFTEYGKRESAQNISQELDGKVKKEGDATSQTRYEYAENNDDVISTVDELNIKDEVGLNKDREEIIDHSVQDEAIGFTEYNQFGNEVRSGVPLSPGVNLVTQGSFEEVNKFSGGKIVDDSEKGRVLSLTKQTAKQELKVIEGQPYNISGSFNVSKESKGAIKARFLDKNNRELSNVLINAPKANNQWIRSLKETVAPPGSVKMEIALIAEKGTLLFDEIQVESAKAGHATSVTPFNFVENGGFQNTDKWQIESGEITKNGYENNALTLKIWW